MKSSDKIKVYVSGPMTGLTKEKYRENFIRASQDAVAFVKHMEHPKEVDVLVVDPSAKIGVVDGLTYADCLYIDVAFIQRCNYIYLMKGWEKSKGARFERHYAEIMGVPILYEESAITIECPQCGLNEVYSIGIGRVECYACNQIIDVERYLR